MSRIGCARVVKDFILSLIRDHEIRSSIQILGDELYDWFDKRLN